MAKQTTKKVITVRTGKSASAAKKAPAEKTSHGPKRELIALLDSLGNDEIAWLLTQAKTMMYNKKVVELNAAAEDLANAKKSAAKPTGRGKSATPPDAVDVVQAGGPKSFNIVMGNAHLFLNIGELKEMVRIAQAAGNAGDGAARLYRWCTRERTDMIADAGLTGPGDARLGRLYSVLRERYSVD